MNTLPISTAASTAQRAIDHSLFNASAVSWAAILAGAAVTAALSLILLLLGVGLGLSAMSPWMQNGMSAVTLGISTILWLALTQLVAAGMGGYLTGRLRVKWLEVDTNEVFFRDSAHGLLSWAMATLLTAMLLSAAITSILHREPIVGRVDTAIAARVDALAPPKLSEDVRTYLIDGLFRQDFPALANAKTPPLSRKTSDEIAAIFSNGLRLGLLPADDLRYVTERVTDYTGISRLAAEQRSALSFHNLQTAINTEMLRANAAAELNRKASAYAALWLFISLLIGAFTASVTAIYGGRQRDI
ncbi:hypothetical protein [Deefgea rivuli]|uniref:hypothetical protein n=1 Tax=Deefgea rivuli TaxID=400948 RepID=UPI00048325F6|nr:hypothetical protein [Deefgea rivuli]